MKYYGMIAAVLMGLSVSACTTVETATRNVPLDSSAEKAAPGSIAIRSVRVSVPETLKVSEANRYYPGGDIVWREDPPGDRHAQVKAIFETAMEQGISGLPAGKVPVVLDIEVTRFHALTEKARYTVGGVHALQFYMVLRDAKTGEIYGAPKFIKADFKALGGDAAINAEREGITQKIRITRHLTNVIRTELTDPNGYVAQNNGFFGALNQL